jgi:hypothetical protein
VINTLASGIYDDFNDYEGEVSAEAAPVVALSNFG